MHKLKGHQLAQRYLKQHLAILFHAFKSAFIHYYSTSDSLCILLHALHLPDFKAHLHLPFQLFKTAIHGKKKKNSETLPPKNGQQRKFQLQKRFRIFGGKMFSNLAGFTV